MDKIFFDVAEPGWDMDNEYYREVGQYYDKDAADYDSRYWANPVLQRMRQSFREETKRYTAVTMLEIGCGTGFDLVHFGTTHSERKIYGIDISGEMVQRAQERIQKSGCNNIEVRQGNEGDISSIFPGQKFDLVYVFFGALNTVDDLDRAAQDVAESLNPGGHLVLTFVNRWYLGGMLMELVRFRFSSAFSRLRKVWSGYSPYKFLPSHCYAPGRIMKSFKELQLRKRIGYCIFHPAWYYTGINKRIIRISRFLWKLDAAANKTVLWRFGEYSLFVFQK
ncbi:MAG: class I SAM-dependent methyltransferase [Bacteroidota bacterium]